MEISSNAFNSGLGAIQSGQRRVDQAAAQIAGVPLAPPQGPVQTPPQSRVNAAPESSAESRPDLAESLVQLRVGQNEAQAGAKLVKSADEMLGTLIDTMA